MVLEKIEVQATFEDEITSRVQNALDTMVEFGATTEQVSQAFNQLNKAQKAGAKGMAQQANVMRTLVDESENADFALRNVAKATTLAAQAGLKLEDAGRQLGQAFRGETAVLQNFDKAAKRAASAIDDITDPALRAKAIMIELNAATRRQNSVFAKLSNQFRLVGALAPNFTRGIKGLAAAFAGAGAAVTAFTAKSLKTYMEGSAKMRRANKRMEKSLKDLQFTFGAIVAQAAGLGDGMKGAQGAVESLTKTLKENRVPIAQAIRDIGLVALEVSNAITLPFRGLKLLFAGLQDVVFEVVETLDFAASQIVSIIVQMMKGIDMGLQAVGKSARFAEDIARIEKNLAAGRERRLKTEFGGDFLKAALEQEEAAVRLKNRIDAILSAPVEDFTIEKRTKPGADEGPAVNAAFLASVEATREYNEAVAQSRAAAASFAASQQELLGSVNQAGIALDANMGRLDGIADKLMRQIELTRLMQEGYRDAGAAVTEFATGAVQMAIDGTSLLFQNLAAGQNILANFGVFLLRSTGELLGQMGQAFIMLGAGVSQIQTGLLSPGALIAIGAGMVALSGALKGFAARAEGGGAGATAGGGGTAAALERFGRRIFERGDADQSRQMTINIEGRSMRGYVLDVAADGARRGSVPLTPRRA